MLFIFFFKLHILYPLITDEHLKGVAKFLSTFLIVEFFPYVVVLYFLQFIV